MNSFVTRFVVIALLLTTHILTLKAEDSISYFVTLNYYWDLSDTYGGGNLFNGEISGLKSWYGAKLSYGHFQSDYIFLFKVPYDEANFELQIPIHEMSFMKTGSMVFSHSSLQFFSSKTFKETFAGMPSVIMHFLISFANALSSSKK